MAQGVIFTPKPPRAARAYAPELLTTISDSLDFRLYPLQQKNIPFYAVGPQIALSPEIPIKHVQGVDDIPHGVEGILNILQLQAENDVRAVLQKSYAALKPDGVFLAVFPGEDTFHELRTAMINADVHFYQKAYPHTYPMMSLRQATQLMQQCGFQEIIVDKEKYLISYPSVGALLKDVSRYGGGNDLVVRQRHLLTPRYIDYLARPGVWPQDSVYQQEGANPTRESNLKAFNPPASNLTVSQASPFSLTVELIYMMGWRPGAHNPHKLAPGAGSVSMTDVL